MLKQILIHKYYINRIYNITYTYIKHYMTINNYSVRSGGQGGNEITQKKRKKQVFAKMSEM